MKRHSINTIWYAKLNSLKLRGSYIHTYLLFLSYQSYEHTHSRYVMVRLFVTLFVSLSLILSGSVVVYFVRVLRGTNTSGLFVCLSVCLFVSSVHNGILYWVDLIIQIWDSMKPGQPDSILITISNVKKSIVVVTGQ